MCSVSAARATTNPSSVLAREAHLDPGAGHRRRRPSRPARRSRTAGRGGPAGCRPAPARPGPARARGSDFAARFGREARTASRRPGRVSGGGSLAVGHGGCSTSRRGRRAVTPAESHARDGCRRRREGRCVPAVGRSPSPSPRAACPRSRAAHDGTTCRSRRRSRDRRRTTGVASSHPTATSGRRSPSARSRPWELPVIRGVLFGTGARPQV